MAKTCVQCHRRVPGEAHFCPRCGGSVRGASAFAAVMGIIIVTILIVVGLFFMVE